MLEILICFTDLQGAWPLYLKMEIENGYPVSFLLMWVSETLNRNEKSWLIMLYKSYLCL